MSADLVIFPNATRLTSDYFPPSPLNTFTGFCKCTQSLLTRFSALYDPLSHAPANLVILAGLR
jgi:hypothetical protein